MNVPKIEQVRFIKMIKGQSQQFGLSEQEYIQKVWYHENASKLGEYMAMNLAEQLVGLVAPVAETHSQNAPKG